MTKEEFIKTACALGYCNKKQAEIYCENKVTLTDDDYIGVYRMVEGQRHISPGKSLGDGGYTSKIFYHDGGSEGNR